MLVGTTQIAVSANYIDGSNFQRHLQELRWQAIAESQPDQSHGSGHSQQRELEKQVRKYGEDAMRVDPEMNLTDATSSIPTESFTRAYQMRMPGSQVEKVKEKDPLASLMKAMQIDVTKTREKSKSDGTKPVASKKEDDGKFHGTRARYPRSRADREPSEIESQYAA